MYIVGLRSAASKSGHSRETFRRRVVRGDLPAYRVGRLLLFDAEELDRWARSCAVSTAGRTQPPA